MTSRDILTLHPEPYFRAKAFLDEARAQGIDLLVTCAYRTPEDQERLYVQGRTAPGLIVTNAAGGESLHNWRCALDVVPVVDGKLWWDNHSAKGKALWDRIGVLGESYGLEWAGRWRGKLRETAHFQYTGGLTLADLQAGAIPK